VERGEPQLTLPPLTLAMEREIHYGRLEAACAFAAANGLNRITVATPRPGRHRGRREGV
jgi:hypothetical protein